MHLVLWSSITLVKKGHKASLANAAMAVDTKCVYCCHPPFEPCVHFYPEQLITVVWAQEQKIADVFDHYNTKDGARNTRP